MSHKFLIIENHPKLLKEGLENLGFTVDQIPGITYQELYDIIEDYEGIVISSRLKVDKTFINAAKNLKYILRPGSGLENVDMAYADKMGIKYLNSPEGNRDAVAEHAIGLLLNLYNHINRANSEIYNHIWLRENNRGSEIMGKTLGIIGFGNTGQALARKLRGFDLTILAYDKYEDKEEEWVTRASMRSIFEKADIVSMHLPLTRETKYFANDQFFRNFRKPITFINTSRGPIVKTSSLIDALERGAVRSAGLDVLENEKLYTLTQQQKNEFDFLRQHPKVLLSPHVAGWTHESKERIVSELLRKFSAQLAKELVV